MSYYVQIASAEHRQKILSYLTHLYPFSILKRKDYTSLLNGAPIKLQDGNQLITPQIYVPSEKVFTASTLCESRADDYLVWL